MNRPRFTENLKTRVTKRMKRAFRRLALARQLDESDLQREAYRDFIAAEKLRAKSQNDVLPTSCTPRGDAGRQSPNVPANGKAVAS